MSTPEPVDVILNPVIHDTLRITGVHGQCLSDLLFTGVDMSTGKEHVFAMETKDCTSESAEQNTRYFLPEDARGLQIGRYRLEKIVGQGRFSTVFAGVDEGHEVRQPVAIKVFRASEEFLDAYQAEVKMLEKLGGQTHPNVVRHLDHFVWASDNQEHGVIVYELMQMTVHALLAQSKEGLPLPRVKSMVDQVAQGLAFLHENGLIHADIKPENLLVDENETVKICDVGSGVIAGEMTCERAGTIPYIAPELMLQCRYDHKVDVWSLACLTFELAANCPLFDDAIYFRDADRGATDIESDAETDRESSDIQSQPSRSAHFLSRTAADEDEDGFFEMEITHFQLCHFHALLGDFPHDLLFEGDLYSLFFRQDGSLRRVPRGIDDRPLATVMQEDLDVPKDVATCVERNVMALLKLDPRDRPEAKDVRFNL